MQVIQSELNPRSADFQANVAPKLKGVRLKSIFR